jgi:hypothetical protein
LGIQDYWSCGNTVGSTSASDLSNPAGAGLATEAASAWIHAAFHDLHLDRLTALVHPENCPSIRILEKLGFHLERRDTIMGMNSILFSLAAKDARAAASVTGQDPYGVNH